MAHGVKIAEALFSMILDRLTFILRKVTNLLSAALFLLFQEQMQEPVPKRWPIRIGDFIDLK
ncbi:hypothetical protein UC35_14885 [Ramlibacter tataouinensis]|uniref:Uncharacterized protein n=1 Tax=Ramlibacter tataouinensis TaxID=94132 RepID=A0A127K0G8_9BURK|nr:hypothetical protein UC35_14885 [Ramlibacter tataouinensis]